MQALQKEGGFGHDVSDKLLPRSKMLCLFFGSFVLRVPQYVKKEGERPDITTSMMSMYVQVDRSGEGSSPREHILSVYF